VINFQNEYVISTSNIVNYSLRFDFLVVLDKGFVLPAYQIGWSERQKKQMVGVSLLVTILLTTLVFESLHPLALYTMQSFVPSFHKVSWGCLIYCLKWLTLPRVSQFRELTLDKKKVRQS
jgi:hypothetical protein